MHYVLLLAPTYANIIRAKTIDRNTRDTRIRKKKNDLNRDDADLL